MASFHTILHPILTAGKTKIGIYLLVYLLSGFIMNALGQWLEIARFTYWWQVFTVYGFYMVPISLLLESKPLFRQYAYGTVAMGLLELGGYTLGTSYIYPGNLIDATVGPHVFALVMTLFFAMYFPLGIYVVHRLKDIFDRFFARKNLQKY